MFNVFVNDLELYECVLEVEVDGVSNVQLRRAPRILIEQKFVEIVSSSVNSLSKIRIKLSREVQCYDEWSGETFTHENSLEYKNNAYLGK